MLIINKQYSFNEQTNEIICKGVSHTLTEKEGRLFTALWKYGRDGEVLSREQLVTRVWPGRERGVTEANLLQLVCKLRRTLSGCGLENVIQTVYRQGYTLNLPDEVHSPLLPADRTGGADRPGRLAQALRRAFLICMLLPAVLCLVAIIGLVCLSPVQKTVLRLIPHLAQVHDLSLTCAGSGYILEYHTRDNQHVTRFPGRGLPLAPPGRPGEGRPCWSE
ncbi:invasion protein regulator [Enterobacter sp. DC4]|uniref:winged helix-turn-helix domain-containing protein n=1 Tax=Enterobacter sp. DC4 TaxID=1395580 RepID=UPI0003ECE215|nr:winged helix-turn-helix domain-containing protein [Enterobacter sp. DC4]EWG65840.1 invasion protein regulator [Enterobacter sp. DC4]